MKHLIKTTLLLLALCLPQVATAYDFEVDGIYYATDLWGDYAMVCDQGEDGAHYSGVVMIPATVSDTDGTTYPVSQINAYAFSNCAELTKVTIPAAVTVVGDHAFENCTALQALELPAELAEIGAAAFENCSGITRMNIPAGVAKIGIWAFQNCSGLTDVYCHVADPSQIDLGFHVFYLEDENYSSRTLHVPAGSVGAYQDSDWSEFFSNIVEM